MQTGEGRGTRLLLLLLILLLLSLVLLLFLSNRPVISRGMGSSNVLPFLNRKLEVKVKPARVSLTYDLSKVFRPRREPPVHPPKAGIRRNDIVLGPCRSNVLGKYLPGLNQ